MFLRRLYYDLKTEEILFYYMMRNVNEMPSVQKDFETQVMLRGRSLTDTGVIEWTEESEEVEHNFETKMVKVIDGNIIFEDYTVTAPESNLYDIPNDLLERIKNDVVDEIQQEVLSNAD